MSADARAVRDRLAILLCSHVIHGFISVCTRRLALFAEGVWCIVIAEDHQTWHADYIVASQLLLAVDPIEPYQTVADVAVGQIQTFGSVLTRFRLTLIDVDLAAVAREPRFALAREGVHAAHAVAQIQTFGTGIIVLADGAMIYFALTVPAFEPWWADAGIASNLIYTETVVLARFVNTFIDV